jgi:hypothetical protein
MIFKLIFLFLISFPVFAQFADDYPKVFESPTGYKQKWHMSWNVGVGGYHSSATAACASIGATSGEALSGCLNSVVPESACIGTCTSGVLVCGGWSTGFCSVNPCPNGGNLIGNYCTSVPIPLQTNAQCGLKPQTVSACTTTETGTVAIDGCIYTAASVSNQWSVKGVPSNCGTWTNQNLGASATENLDSTASIPSPSDIKPVGDVSLPGDLGGDAPVKIDDLPIPPVVPTEGFALDTTLAAVGEMLSTGLVNIKNAVEHSTESFKFSIGTLKTQVALLMKPLADLNSSIISAKDANGIAINEVNGSINALGDSVTASGDAVKAAIEAKKTDCERDPNSISCLSSGTPDSTLPESTEREVLFVPGGLSESGTCPAPRTFNVGGHSVSIPFDPICNAASTYMRPLVLLLASVSAYMIFVGGLKNG